MLKRIQPEVGVWYENTEQETLFEVVSIDDDNSTLALQYFDGELEEIELEAFVQLRLKVIDQPEDWSGPYEIDQEDRDDHEFSGVNNEHDNEYFPFDDFESGGIRVYDDY